jgi:hypothetical protein
MQFCDVSRILTGLNLGWCGRFRLLSGLSMLKRKRFDVRDGMVAWWHDGMMA